MDGNQQVTEMKATIKPDLAKQVMEKFGQNVYLCYQCVKCTSGCPVAEFFDWQPNQIMRALQLGQEDIALQSATPWLCASCQACTTRCPQDLDIAGIMDFLTRESLARGYKPPVTKSGIFNEAFMREVRLWGRSYELGLMAEVKLRSGDLTSDIDLGIKMLQKRKLGLLPRTGRPPKRVKPVTGASRSVAYYPGCSLHSSGSEFDSSSRAVGEKLGLNLIEPKGWVCCGSSAAHRADPDEAVRLPMENLSIIEQSGFPEVTMPCAACYNRHKAAQYEIKHHPEIKEQMDDKLDYDYNSTVHVSSFVEVIHNRVGTETIKSMTRKPLEGLKVACYYGCLLTRPPAITGAEHPENPVDMDEILSAAGADVIDWSYKTHCCGAAHSLTRTDIVHHLSSNLIKHAQEAGAEAIAVACPLCHLNLDARQFQMDIEEPMPILYFTQLLAIALGLPASDAALTKNLVDPQPLLKQKGLL